MTPDEIEMLRYERQLLLLGAKRNEVLDLWEVKRYGADSYGDSDFVSIYGLSPSEWYAKGIRLLGRTAVECTRDAVADAIGGDVADLAREAGTMRPELVLDPFVGSGNTLFWILRHLEHARGLGCELDRRVFELTTRNLSLLDTPIEIVNQDFSRVVRELKLPADQLLIVFVAPPWGEALSEVNGLDLGHTSPPVRDVVDLLSDLFLNPLLYAIQVYEKVDQTSLEELVPRFDWWERRTYDVNPAGQNAGLLFGTKRWTPSSGSTD